MRDSHKSHEPFIEGLERSEFYIDSPESLGPEERAWFFANEIGFQLPPGTSAKHHAQAVARKRDGARFTAIYDRSLLNRYGPNIPVGTYLSYEQSLNVGAGTLIPAHLITDVGVRTEYQGLGAVRRLMTDDLVRAQREGLPIAALTATEGGLYERYGFGVATFQKTIEVDAQRARFRTDRAFAGRVRQIGRDTFKQLATPVFERFHAATLGSIGRGAMAPLNMSGELRFYQPDLDRNPNRRFAVHEHPVTGEIDGYVVYRHEGWDRAQRVVEAIDIVAETRSGYLALWHYLLSQSLTDLVRFEHAPAADVLPWTFVDARAYRVLTEEDLLWLRILDVAHVVEAREWSLDADVIFRIEDSLGLIDGCYRVVTRSGTAKVERLVDASVVDAVIDASALASLYLGGVTLHQLLGTGLVTVSNEAATETLQRLFANHTSPYANTVF